MSKDLFRLGGPHNIWRVGSDRYEARIKLPADADGFVGRSCPAEDCSPGYFKVASDAEASVCPYCARKAEGGDFHTEEQVRYGKDVLMQEAEAGITSMLAEALGLPAQGGRRTLGGGGLISLEMSFKPDGPKPARRPFEEELRRDLICSKCTARHAVFGLATWCPSCGQDIFVAHVQAEADVLRKVLGETAERRARLGARVAARDIENALEDVVSIFEAVLKVVVRRGLVRRGKTKDEADAVLKKDVKNGFQSISRGRVLVGELLGQDLFSGVREPDVERLRLIFEKRHPITHNLGIVDRKYLDQVRSGEREGREVRVSEDEALWALEQAVGILSTLYQRVVGASGSENQQQEV